MKQPRRSAHLASLAVASIAAIACGHDVEVEETAGTTQTTSANVPVVQSQAPADESAATNRSEAPAPVESKAAEQRPRAATGRPRSANRKLLEQIALAAGPDESPLDEAIKTSVRASGQNATATQPEVDEVATTGATVPSGRSPLALASSSVAFANRLPGDYKLERVRIVVDGTTSYDAPRGGAVQLPPGGHFVQVIADYRLSDPIFTYVHGYRVEVQTTRTIPASSAPLNVVAAAVPTGGVTTPMDKRATLAWQTSTVP